MKQSLFSDRITFILPCLNTTASTKPGLWNVG